MRNVNYIIVYEYTSRGGGGVVAWAVSFDSFALVLRYKYIPCVDLVA